MSDKLKNTIQWTLYAIVAIIIVMTLITLIVLTIGPTFFPDKDITGFNDFFNKACIILSFLSVGIGMYSIWQATSSGKQANKMIESLQSLKEQQDFIVTSIKDIKKDKSVINPTNQKKNDWEQDRATN